MKILVKTTLMLTLGALIFASCSDDDDDKEMTNYVQLSINGDPTLYEDATEGVTVTVNLARAVEQESTITLGISGDDKGAVRLSSNTVTFAAGEKTASVEVLSNNANVLAVNEVVYIGVTGFSDSNMKVLEGNQISVTVRPAASVPELTSEQLALINGYKDSFGIDLTKVLGIVDVTTVITFGNDDKETENNGEDTRTLTGKSIITLSENATADKPILKIISNPMSMGSFIYEKYRRCTVEDNEYYMQMPVQAALIKAVNYNFATETFDVTLDDLALNADGTVSFTKAATNEYDEEITKIPFVYTYSVWTRLQQLAESGAEVAVNEGETDVTYSVSGLLEQYNPFNPDAILGNSDISSDAYVHDPSNYVSPTSSYDLTNGTMKFEFSWDYGAGSILYDYIRVNVTYTLHK